MSTLQTKLKIKHYGDPSLRRRAKPLKAVTDKDRATLEEMAELMRLSGGIGLAAPQVGISKQMIVVDVGNGVFYLINPRITKRSGAQKREEGCLSLPGVYVTVKRPQSVTVTGINEKNEKICFSAGDLFARALQHEIDHLRGRLIIDHTNLFQRLRMKKQLKVLKERCAHELF